MTAYERLDLLFEQNNGILKTSQVLENGITKSAFYAYTKQCGVEQAARGVYVSPDAWMDAMCLLHLRCAQAVFSHESALCFHDLADREPSPCVTAHRSCTRFHANSHARHAPGCA